MQEVLIARGRVAKVYRIDNNPEPLVRKEFDPSFFARFCNWVCYKSPHPSFTKDGQRLALHRRQLGSRLAEYMRRAGYIDDGVYIADALGPSQNGFVSPYIEGRNPARNEMRAVYERTKLLEELFDDIGMPTWSFSQVNPLARSNFILQDGATGPVHIIDYEQSVPLPDSRGNFGYDIIYFDDVHRFIDDNHQRIVDELGLEGSRYLEMAFELARQYQNQLDIRSRWLTRQGQKFSRPLNTRVLDETVERLYSEGKLTEEEFQRYKDGKREIIKLATKSLLIHAGIGIATPPNIGTPISSLLRPLWTMGNWIFYTMIHDYEKRRIHSFRVGVVSALPLPTFPVPLSVISNGAYILSVMEESPVIGIAIGDNLWREFTGRSLEDSMQNLGSKKGIKQMARAYEWISDMRPVEWVQQIVLGRNTKRAHDILLGYLMEGASK